MSSISDLESAMFSRGLHNYFASTKSFAKNTIKIELETEDDSNIEIGASKLGGCPDLPTDIDWFREETTNIPLSFICQINFAEIKPYDLDDKLPASGILYLFYDCSMDGMPWGFDPKDASGKKVFFYDGDKSRLERKESPTDLDENGCVFGAATMSFESTLELPDLESDLISDITLSDDERERYWDMLDEADEQINKILGHSDNIQGGMELECELVSHGLYCGDSSGYNEGRAKGLDKNVNHWNLLIQVDSNDEINMMWGDCGRLYLWITDEDLAARRFENSWLILQCG